jgi:amidase
LKRRDFLKTGAAAGGAALVAGCGAPPPSEPAASGKPGPESPPAAGLAWQEPAFAHAESTVADLARAQAEGRLTARALTEAYLARIEAIDRSGPRLNSVIELNPDALAIADALDTERGKSGPRGPLHGIPVLIKDNIDTADRMHTSAGSLALAGSIAPRDAFIVERLRAAGAVIVGKTNLSEWANFRSTRSTSGWSSRGGQTRNPYALDRNPCGSSSGSGAAASANLATLAVGTETDGSITCPSKACGLVGIKPTVGLVSRAGIIPISASQDTAGPMTRTVADAAALLSVLAGVDPRDPATTRADGKVQADYTAFLQADALKGARIGVVRNMFGENALVGRVIEEALAALKSAGAELIDPVEMKQHREVGEAEFTVLLYEFKDGLNAYLASLGEAAPYRSLEQLIAYNDEHKDRTMPWFGQEIFTMAQAKGGLDAKEYRDAVAKCHRLATVAGIDRVMDQHRLDALVAPTGDPAFPTDLVNGDHYTGGGTSTLPAVAGYPHLTVPAGHVFGLPVGLSFFGRAWSEPRLIALAYAFEQATHHRRAPSFLGSAELPQA